VRAVRATTRFLAAALFGLALVTGAALAAGRQSEKREHPLLRALNEAIDTVEREPACGAPLPPVGRRPSLTDDPPSKEMLATLGVLRRPQVLEEREAVDSIRFLAAEGVHRNYIRIARSASGAAFLVVPARDVSFYEPRPRRCVRKLRRRFADLVAERRRPFRRRARRALERIIRSEWTAPSPGEVEGVFMLDYVNGAAAGGSGGASAKLIRRQGMFSSRGSSGHSRVSALLPDGVATLEATFPRLYAREKGRPLKRYASVVTSTVAVQDNVVSFRVPRQPRDAFPAGQIWRDADGTVITQISGGGGGLR
jgi:hypothetical protein